MDLSILGRRRPLFVRDLASIEAELTARVRESSFLVMGGAGSIGQSVVEALFVRHPNRLHVVDLSENSLVELVRDLRSSHGYIEGDFRTLPLDIGQVEFDAFIRSAGSYDFVLNFSALKHVRSEKDPYTLMRLLVTNVLNTRQTLESAVAMGSSRYFAVSSDKAVNPVNAMGASKRAMELCLAQASDRIEVTSARFANVAFSDGSLLSGFRQRLAKRQPLAAPDDVRRFFITDSEAAALCLAACVLGANRELFIPSVGEGFEAIDLRAVAMRFLEANGYQAHPCDTEQEARVRVEELAAKGRWPCYFSSSDTTGEKQVEEFRMVGEQVDLERFEEIGVIRLPVVRDSSGLGRFVETIQRLRNSGRWSRDELIVALDDLLPEFRHLERHRFLDSKM